MKVLSIGNRMSSDAHTFLPFLAKAGSKRLLLSNLCTENASVEDHYRNYIDENEVYYYETFLPGITEMMRPDGIALHEAVEEEDWDFITIQQNGVLSGSKDSYKPYFGEVAAYCRLVHPETKIMIVQPWAFDKGCPLPEFRELYGKNSDNMYEMTAQCCSETALDEELDGIIPIGKAFQIIRQTAIGSRLTLDGQYANEIGQFAAGCVMYEKIFGEDVSGVPYNLPDYPAEISSLIKLCAHTACE